MLTKSGKNKGRRLQNWVAEKIGNLTGLPVGKDEPIESRQMGETGVDIRLDNEARRLFPFSVECKNKETWNVPASIEQAKANTYPGTDWLLFYSKNNYKPIAILDAEAFFSILERCEKLEELCKRRFRKS